MNNSDSCIKKYSSLLFVFLPVLFFKTANAALPIEDCKTFLDESLTIQCLQYSIAEKITDELPYVNTAARRVLDDEDVQFLSTTKIYLSPQGMVNYGVYTPRTVRCYSNHHCMDSVYLFNFSQFIDRALEGAVLSDDDPEYVYYELDLAVSYGEAFVFLKKHDYSHFPE